MAYNFHYTPTGTGVISGKEVLEQTEDAINDLGNTAISGVQEALDKAEQALTNSANAVDDAQTALNTANNADENATTALNTVNNLSGTVTSLGNRVTTAEGNITNLQGRMTTAESGISGLNTRMGTAEGNITTLQSNVSTAQATANSAQQTATTARQQSYVFRYSGTAVVPNSTIAYSTIDNTDNIKSGDKILDVDGKLFEITAVDTANQTVTVGSALIDLALDANVMHLTGNETKNGDLTVSKLISNSIQSATGNIQIQSVGSNRSVAIYNGSSAGDGGGFWAYGKDSANGSDCCMQIYNTAKSRYERVDLLNSQFMPTPSGELDCGGTSNKWKRFNGLEPSSLSLPSGNLNDIIDISSYLPNLSDGTTNSYTAPANGWISIAIVGTAIAIVSTSWSDSRLRSSSGNVRMLYPVLKNETLTISIVGTTLAYARFIPCQGNV